MQWFLQISSPNPVTNYRLYLFTLCFGRSLLTKILEWMDIHRENSMKDFIFVIFFYYILQRGLEAGRQTILWLYSHWQNIKMLPYSPTYFNVCIMYAVTNCIMQIRRAIKIADNQTDVGKNFLHETLTSKNTLRKSGTMMCLNPQILIQVNSGRAHKIILRKHLLQSLHHPNKEHEAILPHYKT